MLVLSLMIFFLSLWLKLDFRISIDFASVFSFPNVLSACMTSAVLKLIPEGSLFVLVLNSMEQPSMSYFLYGPSLT